MFTPHSRNRPAQNVAILVDLQNLPVRHPSCGCQSGQFNVQRKLADLGRDLCAFKQIARQSIWFSGQLMAESRQIMDEYWRWKQRR